VTIRVVLHAGRRVDQKIVGLGELLEFLRRISRGVAVRVQFHRPAPKRDLDFRQRGGWVDAEPLVVAFGIVETLHAVTITTFQYDAPHNIGRHIGRPTYLGSRSRCLGSD